jgi:uncharacterized repeat protein (TIGR03803 family)
MNMHSYVRPQPALALVAAACGLIRAVNFAWAQPLQPEVLVSFTTNGPASPYGDLVQGDDGNFYGTTLYGGSSGYGTVFRVTTNGVLTSLVSFGGTNGAYPYAGLTLGNDRNFYGTTYAHGNDLWDGYGTVFRVTPSGVLTTLSTFFDAAFSVNPDPPGEAGLTLGSDGNFYGTSFSGFGPGYVFKVTTNGVLTVLGYLELDHAGGYTENPFGRLVQTSDGMLYGTATGTLSLGPGMVFQLATNSGPFAGIYGTAVFGEPYAGLTLGRDGNFYGTTYYGGDGSYFDNGGMVFRVTPNGVLTQLVSFVGTNGESPYAALTQGNDGNFYGTTVGGSSGPGTVFQVTTNGVLTTLVSFNGANGANPYAGLTLGRDGNFYGTTAYGGAGDAGVIYRLRHGVSIQSFGMATNGFQLNTLNVGGSGWVVLESSSDLMTWTPIQTNGTAAAQQFLDPTALARPLQFYRVRQQ